MVFAVWNRTIQDEQGNVQDGASVEVRNANTNALATLYSDRDGTNLKTNPFITDADGYAFFFATGGAYNVTAKKGSFQMTFPYEAVGTAAEMDSLELVQMFESGVFPFRTKAEMDAFTPSSSPSAAVVYTGVDSGYYTWSGTAWVYARALPDTFARLQITGGTANAPTAILGPGVNPASPTVFFVDVATPNTGSVTLTITGLGSGVVRNASGSALSAGEWQGRIFFTRESNGEYKIVNDPASALAAAQSATDAANSALSAEQSAIDAATSAGGVQFPVSYGVVQSLTPAEQATARTNIVAQTDLTRVSGVELGSASPADKNVFIDMHSSLVPSDYTARLIKSSGLNGSFIIDNKGTGNIIFKMDAGSYTLMQGGTPVNSKDLTPKDYVDSKVPSTSLIYGSSSSDIAVVSPPDLSYASFAYTDFPRSSMGGDVYLRDGLLTRMFPDGGVFAIVGSSSANITFSVSFRQLMESYGVVPINLSNGGEIAQHQLARSGAVPAKITFTGNSIPAGKSNLTVTSSNMPVQNGFKSITGVINGVHGTLSNSGSSLIFTRSSSGPAATPSPADSLFIPDNIERNSAAPAVLWMGKNNLTMTSESAATIAGYTDAYVNWMAPIAKRVIVLGEFNDRDTLPGTDLRTRTEDVNRLKREKYGKFFVDVQAWLMSEYPWRKLGIEKTPDDISAISNGSLPPSLSADSLHLKSNVYQALFDAKVKPILESYYSYGDR